MLTFVLVEHRGADMESRYYINGRRVLAHDFAIADNAGRDYAHPCPRMETSGRQLTGGRIRRRNVTRFALPRGVVLRLPFTRFTP